MSDDLMTRLLSAPADGLGTENLCIEAADRIESNAATIARLTAERDAARAQAADRQEQATRTCETCAMWDRRSHADRQRANAAEAQVAALVEAGEGLFTLLDAGSLYEPQAFAARAAIAAAKGVK